MINTSPSPTESHFRAWCKVLLSMITLQGMIALPFLLQIPSEQQSSWLLGYSRSRLVLFLLFGILEIALLLITIRFFRNNTWSRTVSSNIHSFVSNQKNYRLLRFWTVLTAVAGCAILIAFTIGPSGLRTGFYGVIILRLQPVIASATLALLEIAIFLLSIYRSIKREGTDWPYRLTIGVFSVGGLTAFIYWILLYLDIGWLNQISNWYWLHFEKGGIHGLRFLCLLALASLVFIWVFLSRSSPHLRLIVLIVFGYLLMIGIGSVEGDNGFEIQRQKLLGLNNQEVYSHIVADEQVDPTKVIGNYENSAYYTMFLGAKPPGTLFLYSIIEKISEFVFKPADTFNDRLQRVTQLISVIFPLLTVLALLPLYKVARQFLDQKDAFIPCILYLTAPNVLLMPVGLDKALYPALFLVGIYLIDRYAHLRSYCSGLLLGLYLYLGLFFSFSLLPLLLWAPLWLLVNGFDQNRKALFPRLIRPLLGVGIGFLVSALAFSILLDYNVVVRYLGAMDWHRYANKFDLTITFLWGAFIVNNIELAVFTGFPLIIIAGTQVVNSLISFIHRTLLPTDAFLVVFLIVYLVLNLTGQMHGEVARTWLFLVTVFSLAAGFFISHVKDIKMSAVLMLVILQLISTYFLLAYQCPCVKP
jgi:hypothetical protein